MTGGRPFFFFFVKIFPFSCLFFFLFKQADGDEMMHAAVEQCVEGKTGGGKVAKEGNWCNKRPSSGPQHPLLSKKPLSLPSSLLFSHHTFAYFPSFFSHIPLVDA
jgi:hypothetical protein